MNTRFVQHVPFEGPGILKAWAQSHGHSVTISRLYQEHEFGRPADTDLLFIMGGPMGVHDESEYPWLVEEKEFIVQCLREGVKIVGICLGAQLVAHALGAKVYANEEKEIGWYPIEWNREALKQPLFEFLPKQQKVLHWHGDTFDIPENAINLAVSSACPRQGFLFNNQVLGLQFHLEMTEKSLEALIKQSQDELTAGGRYVQSAEAMVDESRPFSKANQTIIKLLNRFVDM